MRGSIRSNFLAAVCGGLVVAGALLALGVTGRRTTQTIVSEAPEVAAQPVSARGRALTPHAIYLRAAPGVVFVRALVTQQVQTPFGAAPQRVQSTSTGSGFLISDRGYVLTADHLVEGADPRSGVTVQFGSGAPRPAVVVSVDQSVDLALLKVSMAGLVGSVRPLALGDSSTVRVGDAALAIGNPYGLDRTLSSGIVSALQRQIQAPDGFTISNVIQTDTPITPGGSGGPLLDATGRVIGINSQMFTGGDGDGGSTAIGFAVPINTVKAFLPWLGGGHIDASALITSAGSSAVSSTENPAARRRAEHRPKSAAR